MSEKKFSRRTFLKALAVTGASAALVACTPTKAAEIKPISFLCRTDIKSAYAADVAVTEWNKNQKSQVTMDEPPQGDISQKIQAAQAAGELIWDGYSVMETPWATVEWVKRGIIAPMDDYVKGSKITNADKVVPGIIPTIKEAVSYEGKLYGIPGNVGSVALAWYWEPVKAAGFEEKFKGTANITWDDIYTVAKKIKETSPAYTPFSYVSENLSLLYAMIWGAKDSPTDADGLVDIRSEESLNALEWARKMVDEGLMPNTSTDQWSNWLKKGIAVFTCFDVAGTIAQQTFGVDSADTGVNFFPTADSTHGGCPFWINSSVLLNKAKNPQGMLDFYLWWFGPDNDATGQQITKVAAKPCYQYTYDKFVKGQAAYAWEQKGIDLVAKSKWFPINTAWNIEQLAVTPIIQKLLDPANKFSRDVAKTEMEACYTDIKDQLSKQKFS
jgi:hypothetical protein